MGSDGVREWRCERLVEVSIFNMQGSRVLLRF